MAWFLDFTVRLIWVIHGQKTSPGIGPQNSFTLYLRKSAWSLPQLSSIKVLKKNTESSLRLKSPWSFTSKRTGLRLQQEVCKLAQKAPVSQYEDEETESSLQTSASTAGPPAALLVSSVPLPPLGSHFSSRLCSFPHPFRSNTVQPLPRRLPRTIQLQERMLWPPNSCRCNCPCPKTIPLAGWRLLDLLPAPIQSVAPGKGERIHAHRDPTMRRALGRVFTIHHRIL